MLRYVSFRESNHDVPRPNFPTLSSTFPTCCGKYQVWFWGGYIPKTKGRDFKVDIATDFWGAKFGKLGPSFQLFLGHPPKRLDSKPKHKGHIAMPHWAVKSSLPPSKFFGCVPNPPVLRHVDSIHTRQDERCRISGSWVKQRKQTVVYVSNKTPGGAWYTAAFSFACPAFWFHHVGATCWEKKNN